MTEQIMVKRIRGGSLFKIIVLGSALGMAIISSVFGVFALFGVEVVQWNEQYVTGVKGFIASPFIGMFVGALFGLFTSIMVYLGLRVYSLFRNIQIEYIPSEGQD